MTKRTVRHAPLTIEDLLLLLMRRLLIPVALTELLFGGLFLLMIGPAMGRGEVDFLLFLAPGAITAAGLILVGIPAGYAVARLRWRLPASLVLLAAIGFVAVELPLLLFTEAASGVFGLAAAITAAIWTKVNADLFARADGNA